jgi:hypothetical protein
MEMSLSLSLLQRQFRRNECVFFSKICIVAAGIKVSATGLLSFGTTIPTINVDVHAYIYRERKQARYGPL